MGEKKRFEVKLPAHRVKKVVSVSDTATTDNTGATIGLIRVLTYEL